ncbi:LysR family transcriptional regulator [Burkholderia multivorans]|nr:LysR family transcriptional regulator [Burkholderia multivorans]
MPLADERSAPLTVTAPVAFSEDIPRALRTGSAPLAADSALDCP